MKYRLLSISALILFSVASLFAADFSLQVSQNTLTVVSGAGEKVAQISQGAVGKQVNVGGTEFLLSFGKDVRNNLSAIISPVLDKNSPLSFSTLNKSIKTDGNAIVSIRYSPSLTSAEVDGGYIGRVTVADLKDYNPSGLTPAALVSDVKPLSTKEKEMPKITTKQESITATESVVPVKTPAPLINSLRTQEEGKSLFAVLKEEGIKGLFDSKNMVAGLERSKKSKLVSISKPDLKNVTPMGGMKIIAPELLAKAANDKAGEVRLLDLKGSVLVDGKPATEGALVSQKSVIKTKENGSAVAVLGGLHLVTIHSKSSVSFTQELKEKKMLTLVDLTSGNVFADVNHRKGMIQDFKIKTVKGIISATGSKALVGTTSDGKLIVIVFESTWKGTDSTGANVLNASPLNAPADAGIKIVSFGSIPAMSGAELQDIVNQMAPAIEKSVVQSSPGVFNFVGDPIFSYLSGNSPTLPDGTTNPGATVEGKLRGLVLAITDVVVTAEKDQGGALEAGSSDPTQIGQSSVLSATGGILGGANVRLQPSETSPGGNSNSF